MGYVRREEKKESPEVHVAGVAVRMNQKKGFEFLFAKRESDRELYPELWEGCGGQLARGETLIEGVKRHFKYEFSIEVGPIARPEFYNIPIPGGHIPGIFFLCRFISGEPKSDNHSKIWWISYKELCELERSLELSQEFVPGILTRVMNIWTDLPSSYLHRI